MGIPQPAAISTSDDAKADNLGVTPNGVVEEIRWDDGEEATTNTQGQD